MESVSEKDRLVHAAFLGALHERAPQALQDRKVILESRGFQVLQRTQEARDTRDLKVGLDSKDPPDCQARKVKPDT